MLVKAVGQPCLSRKQPDQGARAGARFKRAVLEPALAMLVFSKYILGAAPFTLALPHAGLVLSSAFSAIVVFAQELVPGKVGMIAGVFLGLMFGISGIGAALLPRIEQK